MPQEAPLEKLVQLIFPCWGYLCYSYIVISNDMEGV